MLALALFVATWSKEEQDFARFMRLSVPDRVAFVDADKRNAHSLSFLVRVMMGDPSPGVRWSAAVRLKWRSSTRRDQEVILRVSPTQRPDLDILVAESLFQPKTQQARAVLARILASAIARKDEDAMLTAATNILSGGREDDWRLVSSQRLSPHTFEWAWRNSGLKNAKALAKKFPLKSPVNDLPRKVPKQ